MKNDRVALSSPDPAENLYPHLKITPEKFPRVLATRRIEGDGAEYFGPFLTRTSVRIVIDFLNRVFRLRTCDLDINGQFPVPCTQFYRKRCLAPCVADLCGEKTYLEAVDITRSFLANDRERLRRRIEERIYTASETLEFEAAAIWRDRLNAIEKWWSDSRLNIWLDDAVDTLAIEQIDGSSVVYLVTQRDRFVLGRKVFTFPGTTPDAALSLVISRFYQVGLPREIRVYRQFAGRRELQRELSERFGRDTPIKVVRRIDQRITARRALHNTRSENELERLRPRTATGEIASELKRIFKLGRGPQRIEAFDVAHISGEHFVAASSVWFRGRFISADARFRNSDQTSELDALADAVAATINGTALPDLIVLDGGRSQLNAVLKNIGTVPADIIAAVKPRGHHSSISHFLTATGAEIGFDPDNPAHAVLQLLRDEAHDLANRVHRDLRDMGHHYELAALLPSLTESERTSVIAAAGTIKRLLEMNADEIRHRLARDVAGRVIADLGGRASRYQEITTPFVVPIRYAAANGNAEDLIPIEFN